MKDLDLKLGIKTVNGMVEPADLGTVAMSEHILYSLVGWESDPWLTYNRAEAFEAVVASLNEFKEVGGGALVDFTGMLLGRDAKLLFDVSCSSGVDIIASTGFGTQHTIPSHFLISFKREDNWIVSYDDTFDERCTLNAERLANLFYYELTQGMVISGMMRTDIRAGIVKAASRWNHITAAEEVSIRGAAMAANEAGVPVYITGITQTWDQLEIMLKEGLGPDRIVFGHRDDGRSIDLEQDRKLASKGAYVAYDHIGWEDKSLPHCISDEQRVELVKAMVESGFTEHIILSCNAIGYALGVPQPGHSFSHLLKSFVYIND
jgi:phosphotriesterase-related protein